MSKKTKLETVLGVIHEGSKNMGSFVNMNSKNFERGVKLATAVLQIAMIVGPLIATFREDLQIKQPNDKA